MPPSFDTTPESLSMSRATRASTLHFRQGNVNRNLQSSAHCCNVKPCLFVSAAPVHVGCFLSSPALWGLVRVLPFLCCWSALMGRLSILECAFWGFLLLFALLHLFTPLRHFVTW